MKIVINSEYGGFRLSKTGVMYYADLKGITVWPVRSDWGDIRYYTVPPEERVRSKELEQILFPNDIPRNDPALVQTVEDLGRVANGRHATLKVVEIPDDVEWEIDSHDGREAIVEKHREWS